MKINISRIFFRLSTKHKMLFARHMSVMSHSGMHLLDSLESLRDKAATKTFRKILDELSTDVRNGQFLSVGLEKYHDTFGDLFVNLVKVGEKSGTLAENFEYLAEELKKEKELKSKVKGAMIYPIIILVATLGITGLLTFLIFPKILPIFKSLSSELPLPTKMFIAGSNFLFNYGGWAVLAIFLLAIAARILLRVEKIKFLWHKFLLKIPVLNNMIIAYNTISFSRTLGTLLKSGIKIVEALKITADTHANLVYKKKIKFIADKVSQGEPMSDYLKENTDIFPDILTQMISIGENTGKLDESLNYLSNFYEDELDDATKTFSTALEPALLLVMGLMVGFVAVAIIGPIYNITQTLGR